MSRKSNRLAFQPLASLSATSANEQGDHRSARSVVPRCKEHHPCLEDQSEPPQACKSLWHLKPSRPAPCPTFSHGASQKPEALDTFPSIHPKFIDDFLTAISAHCVPFLF